MHRKRGLNGDFHNLLNLDSLVDIVSNNVGILVILAVFMAMFSLLEKNEQILVLIIKQLKMRCFHVKK